MMNWTLRLYPDVKDHGFVANPSGNSRDTRHGEEIKVADPKWPRRQSEHRGLGVYVRSVVYVYDRALGRVARGQSEIFRKRGAPPGSSEERGQSH